MRLKEYFAYGLHIATIIGYFFLLPLLEPPQALSFLQYFGIGFFGFGILFVVLSIASQMQNKKNTIIQKGVYALVRHPMYFGAMCLFIAMILFLPHWMMLLLTMINVVVIYRFMVIEESQNLIDFGSEYQVYMKKVPRVNPILGLIKVIQRKKRGH